VFRRAGEGEKKRVTEWKGAVLGDGGGGESKLVFVEDSAERENHENKGTTY